MVQASQSDTPTSQNQSQSQSQNPSASVEPDDALGGRAGATSGEGKIGAQGAEAAEPELEMMVWLEGHEPYVADFCLNADQAMERLGIKRSRLNQISGKELRVGRIKSGRYIKPMYREQDIVSYLQWTRPTASHQASKKALESATAGLTASLTESLKEHFTEGLATKINALETTLDQQLALVSERATDRQVALRKKVAVDLAEWLEPLINNLHQQLAGLERELEMGQFERKQLSSGLARQRRSTDSQLEQLNKTLIEVKQAIASGHQSLNLAHRLEAQNAVIASQLAATAAEVTAQITALVEDKLSRLDAKLAVLSESQDQFVATEFPGVVIGSQQERLDALLDHLDQRFDQISRMAAPSPKPARHRKFKKNPPYSGAIRKKPSLPSHRG